MVVFVSAGLLSPKKIWAKQIGEKNLYLNYGLAGLASIAQRKGHTSIVIHGRFDDPIKLATRIVDSYLHNSDFPLFLSLPSFYAVPWAALFCKEIKKQMPEIKIVIGGRWVVDNKADWILSHIPEIGLIVYGFAEDKIESLLEDRLWQNKYNLRKLYISSPPTTLSQLSDIDYTVIENYKQYVPSIDVSRGCNRSCAYCVERLKRITPLRKPESILNAVKHIVSLYGTDSLSTYFEASLFRPELIWAKAFRQTYARNKLKIKWRCEVRVDTLHEDTLKYLADSGLKVLDIGLESASYTQLVRMRKTRTPSEYLRRASSLLKICKRLKIWCKINVMLYAGETLESVEETLDWMNEHRDYIKGVSCGPLVIYGVDSDTRNFLQSLDVLGCRPVDEKSLLKDGISILHLSKELDYNTANEICLQISRKFMSAQDYYDLKSFSYFPRNFNYSDFMQVVSRCDPDELPFAIDSIGKQEKSGKI